MCGIVEGGVVDIRNKEEGEGRGRGGLSWLQVGTKPGLETVQGPFRYGPGEE